MNFYVRIGDGDLPWAGRRLGRDPYRCQWRGKYLARGISADWRQQWRAKQSGAPAGQHKGDAAMRMPIARISRRAYLFELKERGCAGGIALAWQLCGILAMCITESRVCLRYLQSIPWISQPELHYRQATKQNAKVFPTGQRQTTTTATETSSN